MEGNIFGLENNETPSMRTVILTVKKGGRNIMVWGCMSATKVLEGLQVSTELWTVNYICKF